MVIPPMTKTSLIASTFFNTILLLLVTIDDNVFAAQEVIIVDGREVLLKEDGTWTYHSTDRYANTNDGRRLRLKDDGSWQYVGNAPLTTTEQVRTTNLNIKLQKVVIEKFEKKVQKNTRVRTQTVFYLHLENSAQAKRNISIKKSDISLIEINDNNGKNYPVLSLQPGSIELKPGTNTTLVIRAEKSPSMWDDVKSMEIVFKPGILGIQQAIILNQMTIDIDEEKVNGF